LRFSATGKNKYIPFIAKKQIKPVVVKNIRGNLFQVVSRIFIPVEVAADKQAA